MRPRPAARLDFVESLTGWILTVLAVALQVRWALYAGPLWRDEAATVEFAAMPTLSEIWNTLPYDNFPPFFLVPARLWLALGLGATDAGWRALGLLVGLGALVSFWVVSRAFGRRAPLFVLAFVGLNPLAVRTLDGIRPWGLGILGICLAFAATWKLVATPTRRHAVLATVAAVVSVQTLYQNAVLILALVCGGVAVAIGRRDWKTAGLLFGVGAIAAVSMLVHVPHLLAGASWRIVRESTITLPDIVDGATTALRESSAAALWAIGGGVTLLVVWVATARWQPKASSPDDRSRFAVVALLVAVIGYPMLLWTSRTLSMQPWYFVILVAFVALCLDAATRRLWVWLRLITVAAVVLPGLASAWQGTQVRQTNLDQVAAYVEAHADPRDTIIVHPWYCGITWRRQYHGVTPWTTVPPLRDLRIHRFDLLKEQMVRQDQAAVMAPVIADIKRVLQGGHRVWLIGPLPVWRRGPTVPILSPAPDPAVGWSSMFYEHVWATQAGTLIESHASSVEPVESLIPSDPVNRFERITLIVAEGWHD